MLFHNLLSKKQELLSPAFNHLFEMACMNQAHSGDLLLVGINGFYKPELKEYGLGLNLNPYSIGHDSGGDSEDLHKNFIDKYIQTFTNRMPYEEYAKEHIWSEEKRKSIQQLLDCEGFSIQIEMLSYLKIWEADSFIKKFYQLARLVNGEPYNWHFKLLESGRDVGVMGKRQKIIRGQIRDKFQKKLPALYDAFKVAYKTQIRNSIAHSKYSFQGRYIHLNNYVSGDNASQLKEVAFDEWINIFHTTIMIYILYSRLIDRINSYYSDIAYKNNNQVEVVIRRNDPIDYEEVRYLKHIQDHYWNWYEK